MTGKINSAQTRGSVTIAMVAPGELDVVNMETEQAPVNRFQVVCVIDEAEVFFDLRVAGVVPVAEMLAVEARQEIARLLEGLDLLLGRDLVQHAPERLFLQDVVLDPLELTVTGRRIRITLPGALFLVHRETIAAATANTVIRAVVVNMPAGMMAHQRVAELK